MAFSPDILITALQELLPGYTETWTQFHPAFDLIVEKGSKSKLKNPYLEFGLTPEGPGTVNDVGSDPDKFLNGGRRQSSVRGNEYAATLLYVYDVPGQDLREASGEADLVRLIRDYPERALMDFKETIARQLVMGNGPGCSSVFTFNGDEVYNPKGLGARSGMFEFEASSTQSNTVHGVVSNSIVGWNTQYEHITAMGGDGLKKLRKAYWSAGVQGSQSTDGSPNLLIGDRDSFENYIDELTDFVQFVDVNQAAKGDPAPGRNIRKGVAFQDAVFYPEPYIDIAGFGTPAAQAGVIYGINTSKLHLRTQGSDSKMETDGDFAHRGPIRLPNQDMWRYEYVLSLLIHTTDLRKHFSVTGGANP